MSGISPFPYSGRDPASGNQQFLLLEPIVFPHKTNAVLIVYPAANAQNRTKVTFNSALLCQKKQKNSSSPLTHNSKKLYLLKQTISAGDGSSRNRALAGSCLQFRPYA
jgi:hypothetical protein